MALAGDRDVNTGAGGGGEGGGGGGGGVGTDGELVLDDRSEDEPTPPLHPVKAIAKQANRARATAAFAFCLTTRTHSAATALIVELPKARRLPRTAEGGNGAAMVCE
jgi:hypothetical protein